MPSLPQVLRIKPFRDLYIGQTASQLGDSIYFLVFLFLADAVAKDARITALVATLQALPFVFLGPIAGVVADRYDRKVVMVAADIASTVLMGGLAVYAWFQPMPPVWVLCASAFTMSCVNAFFMPARSAAIPQLVGEANVQEATGLAMMTQQVMGLIGLGVSAGVLAGVFAKWPQYFLLLSAAANSLTFLVSALYILRLPTLVPAREDSGAEPSRSSVKAASRSIVSDAREGFRAIFADHVLRTALPISAVSTLFMSGFMVVYLVVNRVWYGGSFATLAGLELGFVVPMAIFSLLAGSYKVKRMGLVFANIHIALGLMVAAFTFARPYWAFMAVNILAGIVLPYLMVPFQAFIQTAVPDALRGRVNSAWMMVSMGMQPIGLMLTGVLLAVMDPGAVFVVMGLGMALAGAAGLADRRFVSHRSEV